MTRVRLATPTVACIDTYCAHYRSVFHNVRHFEQFTQLILGMLAETKRKSLPRLAKTVQADHQALHHFLANADWSIEELRAIRLRLTREAIAGRPIILCIDETGDPKKDLTTDYVAAQYLGSLHHVEPGIVSVNAYSVLDTVTFPLACALYKPKICLKPGDVFQTKPQLALELIEQLLAVGFSVEVVLADTVSGESGAFVSALEQRRLRYVVAIRSSHGVSGWTAESGSAPRPGAPSSAASPTAAATSALCAKRSLASAAPSASSRSQPIRCDGLQRAHGTS